MVREWRALYRAGEWAGLSGSDLSDFYSVVTKINQEKLQENPNLEDYSEAYLRYLRENVLSDERVLSFLKNTEISQNKLNQFREKEVPISNLFKVRWQLDYDLDHLVDFIMLLKLINSYQEESGEEYLAPRNKLQCLVYLVNDAISNQRDHSISMEGEKQGRSISQESEKLEFGMLRKTGYRYIFRKGHQGPIAPMLEEDRGILHAHDLIQEDVVVVERPGIDEPFGLKIGRTGELLLKRFENNLEKFDSLLLQEWNLAQQQVIREYASLGQQDLEDTTQSVPDFKKKPVGGRLLSPRVDFSEAPDEDQSAIEEAV